MRGDWASQPQPPQALVNKEMRDVVSYSLSTDTHQRYVPTLQTVDSLSSAAAVISSQGAHTAALVGFASPGNKTPEPIIHSCHCTSVHALDHPVPGRSQSYLCALCKLIWSRRA